MRRLLGIITLGLVLILGAAQYNRYLRARPVSLDPEGPKPKLVNHQAIIHAIPKAKKAAHAPALPPKGTGPAAKSPHPTAQQREAQKARDWQMAQQRSQWMAHH